MEATFTHEITAELTGQYGTDLDICHSAWASSMAERRTRETSEKEIKGLINALMREKHGSPFEDGFWRFYIQAPRAVRDEHVRHRIGSYSSASSRYREIPALFYIPPEHRPLKKVEGFKRMRPAYEAYEKERYEEYKELMMEMYASATRHLARIKEAGFDATEAIRWGNTDGQIIPYIARFNPRSMMHFLALRTHDERANHPSHPMWEIEQVARQIEQQFALHLPYTYAAFNEFGREAP